MSTAIDKVKIMREVIEPCLEKAQQEIPFFEIRGPKSSLVLYGAEGALLDSLNLVSFVFLLEERVEEGLGAKIKITTQDVLDTAANPFASLENLARFLTMKINQAPEAGR